MRVLVIIFLLLSVNCSLFSSETDDTTPVVIVSIAPYRYVVKRIADATFNVITVVPDNADPHTYEPALKQILKLRKAHLWFKIGESFEFICSRSLGNATSCKTVDLRNGLSLLPLVGCHDGHCRKAAYDSHIWLSPRYLKIQASVIMEQLSLIKPENRDLYEENLKKFLSELDVLDNEITATLQSYDRSVPILVTHGAYGYFCKDYDLKQLTLSNTASQEPTLKELLSISHETTERHITKLFIPQQTGSRQGIVLADKLKLSPVMLDPYAENVVDNLKHIAQAFSSS